MAELPPDEIARRRIEEASREQKENSSWILPFAAGIGAIALGSKIYKSAVTRGGGVIPNLLHFLGHPTSINTSVDNIANTGASSPTSGLSGIKGIASSTFNLVKKNLQLGPVDLISDVRSSLEILGASTAGEARDQLRNKLTEFVNRRFVNNANFTSYFGDDLQRVTVGEVLGNEAKWFDLIGKNQWQVLKRGVDEGLVNAETALDKNLFKTNKGYLLDTRLRNLFLKTSPQGTLVPRIDVFGQFNVFRSLAGESRGVAQLGPSSQFSGPRYFIGGNVYGYTESATGQVSEVLLETGKKLRYKGDRLEPIRAAREDRLTLDVKERKGVIGSLVSKFEAATGVGTSFSNRRSFVDTFILDPIRALSGLSSGKASVARVSAERGSLASTIADTAYGAEIPELFGILTKAGEVQQTNVAFNNLGTLDKLLLAFNKSPKYKLVRKEAVSDIEERMMTSRGKVTIGDEEYFIPVPRKGGYTITTGSEEAAGVAAKKDTFYTAPRSKILPGMTSVRDFTSYLAYRTSHLASASLFGVSYAPAKTFLGNMARVATVPMIYGAAAEGLEYADYMTEKITGISPKKTLASIYAGIRVNQQKFRETIGLQQGLKALEENYPGSVESGLFNILRSIVAPMATFAKLSRVASIPKAAGAAGAVFALIGGPSPGQSSQELQEEYSGDRKVAIRKGRLWGMGTTPFEGGEISRYDYSWYHKLMSDYRYKSIYGSKDQYFTYHSNVFGVPFPTMQNLGGLLNIFNPYKLEERHAQTRPYEVTSPMFEDVPVFGPALASTIGRLIKPVIERTPDKYLSRQGVLPGGLDPQTARDLGIGEMNTTAPSYSDPVARMQKIANVALEPLGVYKFALEFFGVKFNPDFQERAESSMIDSPSRQFYAMQLGGFFGQTEFLRRFMLSDYGVTANTAAMTNSINNVIPDWLPGSNSKFKRDQTYFINFSQGDPFLKIEDAESRLPGAGYESLNPLHSQTAGEYSPVDRLLILADVAPYSQALKSYEAQVRGMNLNPYWKSKVERALQYKTGMTTIENRYPRHLKSLTDINNSVGQNPIYDVTRGLYDFVTHDVLAEIPWIGTKLAPFRDVYEKYRKTYVEGSEFASWYHPYEDIVRPSLYDIGLSNPFIGAIKGAGTALMMSGPMRFMNPLANVSVAPTDLFNISAVAAGAAFGAGLSSARILAGMPSNYVPDHVREESNVLEYLDKLSYLKNRSLEEYSMSAGREDLAKEFKKMSRKTMVGATNPIAVRSSLPKSSDKKYFDIFVRAPEENRAELLAGLPPIMGAALQRTWEGAYGGPAVADQEVAQYFSNREIPSSDWLGWHPSVDAQSMKLKMVEHGINGISDNYHRFGFYESHERTLRQNYPDLWESSVSYQAPVNFSNAKVGFSTLGDHIVNNLKSSTSLQSTSYGARYTNRLQIDLATDLKDQYRKELR
jgi:hypothetical protein